MKSDVFDALADQIEESKEFQKSRFAIQNEIQWVTDIRSGPRKFLRILGDFDLVKPELKRRIQWGKVIRYHEISFKQKFQFWRVYIFIRCYQYTVDNP